MVCVLAGAWDAKVSVGLARVRATALSQVKPELRATLSAARFGRFDRTGMDRKRRSAMSKHSRYVRSSEMRVELEEAKH